MCLLFLKAPRAQPPVLPCSCPSLLTPSGYWGAQHSPNPQLHLLIYPGLTPSLRIFTAA